MIDSPKKKGRRPDFVLTLTHKHKRIPITKAGSAWVDQWGGVNIHLGPGVTISSDDEVYINLKPYNRRRDVDIAPEPEPDTLTEPTDDTAQNA